MGQRNLEKLIHAVLMVAAGGGINEAARAHGLHHSDVSRLLAVKEKWPPGYYAVLDGWFSASTAFRLMAMPDREEKLARIRAGPKGDINGRLPVGSVVPKPAGWDRVKPYRKKLDPAAPRAVTSIEMQVEVLRKSSPIQDVEMELEKRIARCARALRAIVKELKQRRESE